MRRVTDALLSLLVLLWTLLVVVGAARRTGRRYIVQLDTPALCETLPCTPGRTHARRDATRPGADTRAAAHSARLHAQHTALARLLPPGVTVATLGTGRGTVEARYTTFVNAVAGLCSPPFSRPLLFARRLLLPTTVRAHGGYPLPPPLHLSVCCGRE